MEILVRRNFKTIFLGRGRVNDSLQEQGVEYKYLPLGLWREVKEYI